MRDDLQHVFAEGGLLAREIDGFQPRQAQQEMADKIAQTLQDATVLVAEAGTGTGKTFAYLAPAILAGQKVFISTGTKNLQDQLFHRDLPTLKKALGVPFRSALLKGRGNYLCHHRLGLAEQDVRQTQQQNLLQTLRNWSTQTETGDLSETTLLDDHAGLWPMVTSTVDNCLGQQCPEYQDCFILQARREAQEADIVVINHHLLMSDFALKTSGQGEVLPHADAFIIDEAHQLPAIAGQFLGHRLSSHQLAELVRDAHQEMQAEAADMPLIAEQGEALLTSLQKLRIAIGNQEQRTPWQNIYQQYDLAEDYARLTDKLDDLNETLKLAAERSQGLKQCQQRADNLMMLLDIFHEPDSSDELVLWLDNRTSGFILHATPFDISQHFQQWLEDRPAAWVFTSATLTVSGQFNHFTQQLGIYDAITACWQSPFNFQQQSLLYMPANKIEPADPKYSHYVAEVARSVIALSEGRTFLLFTSYRTMHEVAEILADSEYPLMIQGTGGKARLLEDFRQHGNAVLLGTNSFWEGVDVRGEALRCVLIDKIPFASPGDPVLEARINNLKSRGGNPFRSIQIPSAVIQLKQGIGRLIRDTEDYGVLVLCDPRFLSKPYGKVFLRSLPAMPITQNLQEVAAFYQQRLNS